MESYRRLGYDFLAISDHDMLTWPDASEVPDGLTLIPSLEAGVGPHVLCVGVEANIPKMSDRQAVIDRTTAQGGIAILNHPNWGRSFSHWDQELMESLRGYAGIEIYNAVIEPLEGSPYALDRWDRLLTAGHRVWGFANDDSHSPVGVGFGWNVVQAEANEPGALVAAMREGRFYASTGATIRRNEIRDEEWIIESPDADRIRFSSRWGMVQAFADAETRAFVFRTSEGSVTGTIDEGPGMTVRYRFRGDEGYVRCEVLGRGGRAAWTQPVWVSA
jgi:hypothetical protein